MTNLTKLINYICSSQGLDRNTKLLIKNILGWIWLQSMDKEDTIVTIKHMLDGVVNISENEIAKFIEW